MADISKNTHAVEKAVPDDAGWATKVGYVLHEESVSFQPRMLLLQLIGGLIPHYVGSRTRRHLLRIAGIAIGHGTIVMGMPRMYGAGDIYRRLQIGSHGVINIGCFFDLSETISIGNHVALGHEVMILTSSHHIGGVDHRAGSLFTAPVSVGDGAWIGSRCIILPGITIGAGSVVAAGAIVTKDVPPSSLVGGVPARMIRQVP
jgi:maltose O-acetyltransferase